MADGRVAADAPAAHLRAAIAEELGWRGALSDGQVGIQGPGQVTTPGPDFITYDSRAGNIIAWDAKYTTSSVLPRSVSPSCWMYEIRSGVANYSGSYADEIQQAFTNGQITTRRFLYPPR